MAPGKERTVALVGNPNSGKTSLFNLLTGLRQKVGNYPGITVDKKIGYCRLQDKQKVRILDLPGTYSLYPRSQDEEVVSNILLDPENELYPDLVVVVVDATNLKRSMLLFSQIRDLQIPVILGLNMVDVADKEGYEFDIDTLSKTLGVPVIPLNSRIGKGVFHLKRAFSDDLIPPSSNGILEKFALPEAFLSEIKQFCHSKSDYAAFQLANQSEKLTFISPAHKKFIAEKVHAYKIDRDKLQAQETLSRYDAIEGYLKQSVHKVNRDEQRSITRKLDRIFTHRIWGYIIFFLILFLVFQAIFAWAEWPMDLIDTVFAGLSASLKAIMPAGVLRDLLTEGVIPGIGGVVIFIPQIAILFAFIAILEETGYMSRVVFIMDKIMRRFGLNGRSVVPLMSGVACAIPAIMSARSIDHWKERLITIFITPLMSCSARLPVYAILIGLAVPQVTFWGIINLQGLALMGMYLLGLGAALASAVLLRFIMKTRDKGYLMMELPLYKIPRWKNVGLVIYEKSRAFVVEAGKIIIAISIILWVLASYGPASEMERAEQVVQAKVESGEIAPEQFDKRVASYKLSHSYAGIFGRTIEPVIEPLGYDWKIGIALITSFAAREVFVGTMSTIYSIEADEEDVSTIRTRMKNERDPETGEAVFTVPVAFSLLIFYAFAMQCMSTLAVVYRETKGWKWPLLQLFYMTGLAYISALVVYNLLS